MKRLLAITIALLLAPITASAISMSELDSNPEQYNKVVEDRDHIIYIDTNTIESLRYSPPYYTMRCNFYIASYSGNTIYGSTITVDYDYNRSMITLMRKILAQDKNNGIYDTKEQLYKKLEVELSKDEGMRVSLTNAKRWDLDGNLTGELSPSYGITHVYGKSFWAIGSCLFKLYYNEPF